MTQRMMWIQREDAYRGQAADGTVITVAEDAMALAQKKAGNGIYEADWWAETLTRVLEHWGVYCKRWTDPASQVPRLHFTLGEPGPDKPTPTGPLSARIMSGPLGREKRET